MANRPAPALVLGDGDRERLASWLRSRSVKAGLVKRARIVLLAADGVTNQEHRRSRGRLAHDRDRVA